MELETVIRTVPMKAILNCNWKWF